MADKLTFWKCFECQGSGEVILGYYCDTIKRCERCDGTGNALIDGPARIHRRRLDEIRNRNKTP